MAEAAVELQNGRFFCHRCTEEVSPVLPEFTCPRCEDGFVEKLEQNALDSDYLDDVTAITPNVEVFGMLGNQTGPSYRPGRDNNSNSSSSSSRGRNARAYSAHLIPAALATIRPDLIDRGGNGGGFIQLEGLIQQVFADLASGGLVGNASIPVFFNLHGNPADYAWGRGGLDAVITHMLNQLDCAGPPPLAKEKIDQIPTAFITKEQVDTALQCTVCMEDFKVKEAVRTLACQHQFHTGCIVPWLELHGTCPICRKSLHEEDADGAWNSSSSSSESRNASHSSDMDYSSRSSSSSSSSTSSSSNSRSSK